MKNLSRVLLFLALGFPSILRADGLITLEPQDCKLYAGLTAGSDRNSAAINIGKYGRASFQVSWASLTGSVDAVVKVQVASVPVPASGDWVDKAGATFTMSGADGTNLINVQVLGEKWARVVYTHTSVSGGTITGYCHAKST